MYLDPSFKRQTFIHSSEFGTGTKLLYSVCAKVSVNVYIQTLVTMTTMITPPLTFNDNRSEEVAFLNDWTRLIQWVDKCVAVILLSIFKCGLVDGDIVCMPGCNNDTVIRGALDRGFVPVRPQFPVLVGGCTVIREWTPKPDSFKGGAVSVNGFYKYNSSWRENSVATLLKMYIRSNTFTQCTTTGNVTI